MYVYMGFSSSTRGPWEGTWVSYAWAARFFTQSLGWEGPLEEDMGTHCGILAWRILWTEEPGGLQSTGSQRVGHDWSNLAHTHTHTDTHTHVSHIQRQRERSTKRERNRDIENTFKENHSQNVKSYLWIKWLQITFSVFFFVCFWLF